MDKHSSCVCISYSNDIKYYYIVTAFYINTAKAENTRGEIRFGTTNTRGLCNHDCVCDRCHTLPYTHTNIA